MDSHSPSAAVHPVDEMQALCLRSPACPGHVFRRRCRTDYPGTGHAPAAGTANPPD